MNRSTMRTRADLADHATHALEAASSHAARALDRHASEYEMSDAKLELLAVLRERDGHGCCLHELGDALGVTRPNVTKLIDGLERGGLVRRAPHPGDGRMVQARLTSRGAAVVERALPGRRKHLEAWWCALDDDELGTLIALLERVAPETR